GLSRWTGDWQPDPCPRELIGATGLVPVKRRLTARPTIVAPRGQAPWRPSLCVDSFLAISHRGPPGQARWCPCCNSAHGHLAHNSGTTFSSPLLSCSLCWTFSLLWNERA